MHDALRSLNSPSSIPRGIECNTTEPRARLLLVDDRPDKALAIRSIVEELGHELVIATSGLEGLRHLLNSRFQLLLLDVEMPEMDGLEMARLVRERQSTADLPIIFVSAVEHGDERLERAYSLGAVDFIQLPERRALLRAKLVAALKARNNAEQITSAIKENEQKRLATEERLRLLLENAHDLSVFFVDESGTIVDWSRGAESCFGWQPREIIGQSLSVLFTPQDVVDRIPQKKLSEALHPDATFDERWMLRKDGTRFWITSRFVALSAGTRAGFAVVARDTTDRLNAEQNLRIRSEVLTTMTESVCVVDYNLTILYTNPAAERTFGYAPGELVGVKVTLLNNHPPDENASMVAKLVEHLNNHGIWEGEWQNRRKDGTPFSTFTRVTLLDHRGNKYYVCVQEDLTAWKQAHAELTRAKEELESRVAARTAELKQLVDNLQAVAYSISHDVKTPLRAIAGYAEAILEDHAAALPTAAITHLRQINSAAQRLQGVVLEVLAQSRKEHAHEGLIPLDIGKALHDVLQQELELHARSAEIHFVEPALPVLANPALLSQVLRNLLTNAAKFVRPGIKPKVVVRTEAVDDGVKVWVEDNGIGISVTDRERIFQMFERGSAGDNYEGSGVGLSIARKAVEKMQGTIGVESMVGRGSRFWFKLKRAE